jgi:sulfopyruvate decarboxylase TPP-binding subunit
MENCVGVCTGSATFLAGKNYGLIIKIKDIGDIVSFIDKTWSQKKKHRA